MGKGNRIFYFKKILPFLKENKKIIFMLILCKVGIVGFGFLSPLIYKAFIEKVITDEHIGYMIYIIGAYLVLYGGQTIFVAGGKYFETVYMNKLTLMIKRTLLRLYMEMDYCKYEKQNIGDIRYKIEEDTRVVSHFFSRHILEFCTAFISAAGMMIVSFFISWQLALFGILSMIVSFWLTKVIGEKIRIFSEEYRNDQGSFEGIAKGILENWKEIKIYNLQEKMKNVMVEKWNKMSRLFTKRTIFEYLYGALIAVNVVFVTRMNFYFLGGVLVAYGFLTVVNMLVFMNYYEQVFTNMQEVSNISAELKKESVQLENVFEILESDRNKLETTKSHTNFIKGSLKQIRVENLSFRYRNDHDQIFQKLFIEIPGGKATAIVGKSGCGKSTLAKILVGLYYAESGKIYYGEEEISQINQEVRHQIINIVFQDPYFFNASILDNMRLAKPDATMLEINNACKKADIYDFIQQLPDKYETVIGQGGTKLSGGQKQRLAIARTLLFDPEILILDESTSALDVESEEKVVNSIIKLKKEKTILFISHRPASIEKCDNIIHL